MATKPPFQIDLADSVSVHADGRRLALAYRGAEGLLAYLALNGPSARAQVAADLWPRVDRERALASLRQALRAVVLAGGEGLVVADRSTLRLAEAVAVRAEPVALLEGWDEPWLARHRAERLPEPPVAALFDLIGWYADRSPATAVGLAAESLSLVEAVPAIRQAREFAPLLARVSPLPTGSEELCFLIARAHYLVGDLERAFALFERIAREFPDRLPHLYASQARLSQVVILRESGAPRNAADLAGRLAANPLPSSFLDTDARYHLGYSLYLAGRAEGLTIARAAVESEAMAGSSLGHLFPILNVAEGLLDTGDAPGARALLPEAARRTALTDDALAGLNLEAVETLLLAGEAPDAALARYRDLERRAWEARLTPFAAGLADRAASLAFRVGHLTDARRLLRRGDRVRHRLGIRRTAVEKARLAPLRYLA